MSTYADVSSRRPLPKHSKLQGKCSTGKLRYRDHRLAVKALHNSQASAKAALELTGTTARNESRAYACKQCNGWHLTSRQTWNDYRTEPRVQLSMSAVGNKLHAEENEGIR